jgi:Ca2+-binding RTX toxin-like protein
VILEWEEDMSAKQAFQNFLSRACLQIADRSRRRVPRRAVRIEPLETRALLATFTVTSNSDSGAGSLRNMISLANDTVGTDVIVFSPSTNGIEFDLSSTSISIAGSLTITGNGAALTVIDAQQMSQIFDIKNTAVNVTISNVTLKNGRTTGTNGTTDNEFSGGAIRSNLTGTLTINQSTLSGNRTTGANASGGAIYSATGAVVINQSSLSGNSTSGATSTGGAIASLSGAISVNGSTISGNSTTGDLGYGGAIASESGAINVTNSTLSGNFTTKIGAAGGAIASGSGAVTIRESTLSGNSTAGQSASGGAIGSSSGTVVISQSTLSGNSTAGASANGGAIATVSSPVTVSQSTISGNQATAPGTGGGGLWSDAAPVTIVNSTITSNSATGSGGGLRGGASQKLTIRNSIIAANTGSSSNPDFTSPLSPATNLEVLHSLIGRNNGTSLTQTSTIPDANGNLVGGDNPGAAINPQLGPLGGNGGPTQTHALLINSPAFNGGSNALAIDLTQPGTPALTVDQRGSGFSRTRFGIVDMGAFESALLDSLEGTTGDDAFVLTYSSTTTAGTVTVTVSTGGGPVFNLGTFPMNSPLTINGLGGTDSVRIVGNNGADTFVVNSSNILTVNGASLNLTSIESRTLAGRGGNDINRFDADAALGTWTLDEVGGTDTIDLSTTTTLAVTLNLGLATTQVVNANLSLILGSATQFENAIGGTKGDMLTGNSLNNTLTGGPGNDILNGLGGHDNLFGGLHNDTYVFGPATAAEADRVHEFSNEGTDIVSFAGLTTGVTLNLNSTAIQPIHTNRTLKLNSVATFENATGGSGNDVLLGNVLANRLIGGNGHNILVGNDGADILTGGTGRDILIGGRGLDTLNSGANDDILIAGRTTSDANISRLLAMQAEWISANAYATRITNLRAGVGSPAASLKAKINVLNDAGEDDILTGGAGRDWYFRAIDDLITDLFASETIDVL